MEGLDAFTGIWAVDSEYIAEDGDRPDCVCLVAKELRSKRVVQVWQDKLLRLDRAPFDVGAGSLFVAYSAHAELECFAALGWPFPVNVIDLMAEFQATYNGRVAKLQPPLLYVMDYYSLPHIGAGTKANMIALIRSGGPWTRKDRTARTSANISVSIGTPL